MAWRDSVLCCRGLTSWPKIGGISGLLGASSAVVMVILLAMVISLIFKSYVGFGISYLTYQLHDKYKVI